MWMEVVLCSECWRLLDVSCEVVFSGVSMRFVGERVEAGYLSSIVDERWIEMISEKDKEVLGYCRIE